MNYQRHITTKEAFLDRFHNNPNTRENVEKWFKEVGYSLKLTYSSREDPHTTQCIRSRLVIYKGRTFFELSDTLWPRKTSYFHTSEYSNASKYLQLLTYTTHRDFVYPDSRIGGVYTPERIFGVILDDLLRPNVFEAFPHDTVDSLEYSTMNYSSISAYMVDVRDQVSLNILRAWIRDGNVIKISIPNINRPGKVFVVGIEHVVLMDQTQKHYVIGKIDRSNEIKIIHRLPKNESMNENESLTILKLMNRFQF